MADPWTSPNGYDYLVKLIIIGDSSTGKSTLLHHFLHQEFAAKSHTVGVEFQSKLLILPPLVSGEDDATPLRDGDWNQQQRQTGQRADGTREPPASAPPFVQHQGKKDKSMRSQQMNTRAVKLQVWDSAGQERFRSVTRSYYRGAAGCLLVYDVTKRSTFASLPRWLTDVRALASEQLVVIVVGNKTDLASTGTASQQQPEVAPAEAAASSSDGTKGREVPWEEGKAWAESESLLFVETSALAGDNVESPFSLCARGILSLVDRGLVQPDQQGSGVTHGDRSLSEDTGHKVTSSRNPARFSFVDVVQSGGGVSRSARRLTGAEAGGSPLIRVKQTFAKQEDGGCC